VFRCAVASGRVPRDPSGDLRGALPPMKHQHFAAVTEPKEEMSGHGFRAMARTVMDEVLGFRVDWIEHQMAHAVRDPNGRAYNRTAHLAGRRKMMQTWADWLDRQRTGAKVIQLKTGRR
jgi:integrase